MTTVWIKRSILIVFLIAVTSCGHQLYRRHGIPDEEADKKEAQVIKTKIRAIRSYDVKLIGTGEGASRVIRREETFDTSGRLSEVLTFDRIGRAEYRDELKYDSYGNLLSRMSYDSLGRFIWGTEIAFDANRREERFWDIRNVPTNRYVEQINLYDSDGRQIEWSTYSSDGKPSSRHIIDYDDQNRVTAEREIAPDGIETGRISTFYDHWGRKSNEVAVDQSGSAVDSSIWRYDQSGRLLEYVCGDVPCRMEYSYDSNGLLLKEIQYGSAFDSDVVVTSYEYDAKGNPTRKSQFNQTTGKPGWTEAFEYDYY